MHSPKSGVRLPEQICLRLIVKVNDLFEMRQLSA